MTQRENHAGIRRFFRYSSITLVGLLLGCFAWAQSDQALNEGDRAPKSLFALAEPQHGVGVTEESTLQVPAALPSITLILIPAGTFTMGATAEQQEDFIRFPGSAQWIDRTAPLVESSGPAHEVNLDSFYIFKFDVTNAQYQAFVRATGHQNSRNSNNTRYNGPNQPVTGVTWNDARSFCAWAGAQLPTEAQWEKAARGTEGFIYPWGNVWDATKLRSMDGIAHRVFASIEDWQAWRATNQSSSEFQAEARPADAGSYPKGASPYGVMDMAGNVWEWVADWYDPSYYKNSPNDNPKGPSFGDYRVLRGGAWDTPRIANFTWYRETFMPPSGAGNVTGFRCVTGEIR